jgi:hypothetical protein
MTRSQRMNRTSRDQTREPTPAPVSPFWALGNDPTGCREKTQGQDQGQGHVAGILAGSLTGWRHATSRPRDTASTTGLTHDGGNQRDGGVEEEERVQENATRTGRCRCCRPADSKRFYFGRGRQNIAYYISIDWKAQYSFHFRL